MRKRKAKEKSDSQVGKVFGNPTVVGKSTKRDGRDVWILHCDCGQFVYLESLHTARQIVRSCLRCGYDGQQVWAVGEIAECDSPIAQIPIGAQVIVMRQIDSLRNPHLVVEYSGKRAECRASDLQSLGVIF